VLRAATHGPSLSADIDGSYVAGLSVTLHLKKEVECEQEKWHKVTVVTHWF